MYFLYISCSIECRKYTNIFLENPTLTYFNDIFATFLFFVGRPLSRVATCDRRFWYDTMCHFFCLVVWRLERHAMDRKRKANTLVDNEEDDSSSTGGDALLGLEQIQIPDLLIPHVLSYCNDNTLKRSCACVSRSWYNMVTKLVDLKLWNDVSENLLTHQIGKCQDYVLSHKMFTSYASFNCDIFPFYFTVAWRQAVDSLKSARTYLKLHPCFPQYLGPVYHDSIRGKLTPQMENLRQLTPIINETNPGRSFIDRHMRHIVQIYLAQQPYKIRHREAECVKKSLKCAIRIIQEDLECVNDVDLKGLEELPLCPTINALGNIFGKEIIFYKRGDRVLPSSDEYERAPPGLPEVRSQMIKEFRRIGGFLSLFKYLEARLGRTSFPKQKNLQYILDGLREPETVQESLAVYSEDSELEARALFKLMLKHELISFLCNPETNIARVERENICSVLKRIREHTDFDSDTDSVESSA